METMDTVVVVAIGILATIFIASLVALVIVCRHKYCRRLDLISAQHKETRPDVQLIASMETPQPENVADLELDEVQIMNPNLEAILRDENWVDDATWAPPSPEVTNSPSVPTENTHGLVPHCIEILKTCHQLTERLVGMTMGNSRQLRTQESLTDIIAIAKRISPRVDEVMSSMYPPLDPRLLEARCTALVLSVSHLVLITKNACRLSGVLDWIDQSLADVDDHLKVLRDASMMLEPLNRSTPSGSVASGDSQQPMVNQSTCSDSSQL